MADFVLPDGYTPSIEMKRGEYERRLAWLAQHGAPDGVRRVYRVVAPHASYWCDRTAFTRAADGYTVEMDTVLVFSDPSTALTELQAEFEFGDPFKRLEFPPPQPPAPPTPRPEERAEVGAEMPGYVPRRYWPGAIKATPGTVMTHAQTGRRIVFRTGRANPFMPDIGYWEELP